METNLTRTDSLGVKGAAIIIMVIFHCFYNVEFYALPVNFWPFTQDFVIALCWWGKLCVSMFAFVSGYGLYLSYVSTKDTANSWLAKRYIKTFSGYWFVFVLVFIVTLIMAQHPMVKFGGNGGLRAIAVAIIDFLGLARLFNTPTLCGAWWYMSAAVLYICMIPLLVRLDERIGWFPILFFLIAFPRLAIPGYSYEMNPITFAPPMFLGFVFAKYGLFDKHDELCARFNRVALFVVDTVIMVATIVVYVRLYRPLFWEFHYTIAPVIFIIYLRRYVVRLGYLGKALQYFGKHSMNIYLIHMVIQLVLFPEWIYSFSSIWVIPIVLFAVSLAASIAIEAVKKLVRYDKLIDWLIGKVGATPELFADGAQAAACFR